MRAGSGLLSLGSAAESATTMRSPSNETAHGGEPSTPPAAHCVTASAPSRYRYHAGPPRSQSSWLPRIITSGAAANTGLPGENQSASHDMLVSPQRFWHFVMLGGQLFSR